MQKTWKILNQIILSLLILICGLGIFYKHISFGLGLGDIFGYFILYVGTLVHLIFTIKYRHKGGGSHLILFRIFSIFLFLISLYATLLRGPEYRWNGSIFYLPCPTRIKVQNPNEKKELLIQMCSMEYYSEVNGTWDSNYFEIKSGEIKIPKELEKYILRPITRVKIVPDVAQVLIKDSVVEEPCFTKDTLKANLNYILMGEIMAIENNIPVMRCGLK